MTATMARAEGMSTSMWLRIAMEHHQCGRISQAETLYRQILQADPGHADALHLLGAIAQQQGNLPLAVELIGRAVRVRPAESVYLCNLGNVLQQQGRLEEAVASYRQALRHRPDLEAIHMNLGNVFKEQGRLDEAVACYRQALAIQPSYPAAHCNLGNALKDQGRLEDSIASYQRALQLDPDHVAAHYNLGNILHDQGMLDEAMACYRRTLSLQPGFAEAHVNLGNVSLQLGHLEESVASYRQALLLKPDHAEAHNNLGNALRRQGLQGWQDEAMACYRQALTLRPAYVEALGNLGNALREQGRLDEAIECYRQALSFKPDHAETHNNLGNAFQELGWLGEAMACYRQAIALKPDYVEAHGNLGCILKEQGLLDEAIACHRQALAIQEGRDDRESADTFYNLGNALLEKGELDKAIDSYRQALSLRPAYAEAHSNLIFALDLKADIDLPALQAERLRWGVAQAADIPAASAFANTRDPERRLRIGYVSADFRNHSAAVGFGAMLTRFDAAGFEVFAYANSKKEDAQTRIFRQGVNGWRNITGLSDAAVAEAIRQDGIDILVDLSGHSGGNRLPVFAIKPAPIQVTAWGYAGGTGLRAMDVLFTDPVIVPPEERCHYVEDVRYLPSVISTFFSSPFPAVSDLPALSESGVVFGSFNRLAKISEAAFTAWVDLLLAVPASRLILKMYMRIDDDLRQRVLDRFTRTGIAPERIILLGKTGWIDHVAAFNLVDISLDTFPQCGGVTTLESLMMGVPVVTLRGNTFAGRGSSSVLRTLGLTGWIAATPGQYIDIAVRQAQNLVELADLRRGLRTRLTASIIGDAAAYVAAVEREYRNLWREWCRSVDGTQ